MKKILLIITLAGLALTTASGQAQGQGNRPPGDTVVGKITSVDKDSLVITPVAGGDPITVKITENTRIMKQREPIKLGDIKPDETVFARGELKNNTLQAVVVGVVNPQMVQRMGSGGPGEPGGLGPGGFNRDDLGKKFIAGEVKAIHETMLTIARPDGQSQDIQVDENTSFRRGQESITLPDIKTGEFVRGPGELKDGVFVAKELNVGRGRMRFSGGQGNPATQNPSADKPPQTPPKN
jgi:hypothetical protein